MELIKDLERRNMSIADLIAAGYGGYQGWTDEAAAAADFAATGGSGKWTGGAGGGGGEYGAIQNVPSVTGYIGQQIAAEDPYLTALLERMGAREQPLEIYRGLEAEQGLPELRQVSTTLSKEIANLEDYLLQIEPMIAGRTRESLVTEPQRVSMVAAERKEPLEKLTRLGTALGRVSGRISEAESGVATKVQLALEGQKLDLEPYQLQYSVMVDRNARLASSFSEDRETLLDTLWRKLEREQYLSDREWETANTLAQYERQYLDTLRTSATGVGIELKGTETTGEILALIGSTVREEVEWERGYKVGEYEGEDIYGIDAEIDRILEELKEKEGGGASASPYYG